MLTIKFSGVITSGIGKHVELYIPGRSKLSNAPSDWPEKLHPGSLNIRVDVNGYPDFFKEQGLENTIQSLDADCFPSTFQIKQKEFGNNRLKPKISMPERGSAQVWRAKLEVKGLDIDCWVLRRYGSGLIDQIEVVAEKHLRKEFGLEDEDEVAVWMWE